MKVYRYLSQNELDSIISNNTSSIGGEYTQNEEYRRINNHRYKSGIKYLHFFKHKNDCQRVGFISDGKDVDFYIAEFNIPTIILIRYIGYGKYDNRGYGDIEKVLEFAIPASKFKSKYLRSYVRDEVHHRSLEENKHSWDMLIKCKDIFKHSSLPEFQRHSEKEIRHNDEDKTPEL